MRELTNVCARSEDLIAYLYEESTSAEATAFEDHLRSCMGCRAEMKAFGLVRDSIGEWRQRALGSLPLPVLGAEAVTVSRRTEAAGRDRRSALGAIREFFTLSPAWMRAATVAVVLVFCTLAFIAVAYFSQQPTVVVVEKPALTEPVKSETAKEAGPESKPLESTTQTTAPREVIAVDNPRSQITVKRRAIRPAQVAGGRRQIAPNKSSEPSTELASANDYLPFTVPSAEDKLPSLVDLADEPN
jgi:anti-sigma factor RsiW